MKRQNEQLDSLIAALQLLRQLPVGAENEPDQHPAQRSMAAMNGRSDAGFPHLQADRPTQIEVTRLRRENDVLIHHAEIMARAVGACANCWGACPDCEDCGGIGRPGAFDPDRAAFDRYVLPVLTRVMGERAFGQDVGQTHAKIYPLSL